MQILHADIHLIDLSTRLPFKYGIATMTSAPHAFVRVRLEVAGGEHVGVAADHLPPKWFKKDPQQPLDAEIDEMLRVIEHAVAACVGLRGDSAFDLWRQLDAAQSAWGAGAGLPPLLNNFGATLIERAVIEAVCKADSRPFSDLLRGDGLGIDLGVFDVRLAGVQPSQLLPGRPRSHAIVRHTVGMADPLTAADIAAEERLQDGLPQSLAECVRRYGLRHLKIKLSGAVEADVGRLERIAGVMRENADSEFAFTVDGNEHFHSLAEFREYWETLPRAGPISEFLQRLMFVEQPFHRDVALDCEILGGLRGWRDRPRMIIDESDAERDSLPRALELGYHGTSHKNCKGVFRGVANACLLEKLTREESAAESYVMSGEDLANIGPVALLQDLAVAAALGVDSIERNGHHYFAGLSAFSRSVQQSVLAAHGDIYEPSHAGWPMLKIEGGELRLDTINAAPLGVAFALDVEEFTPVEKWR